MVTRSLPTNVSSNWHKAHTTGKRGCFLDVATVKDQSSANSFQWIMSPFFAVSQLSEFYWSSKASQKSRNEQKSDQSFPTPTSVTSISSVCTILCNSCSGKKPAPLPFIICLAVNSQLIESISHEELRPFIWNQMLQWSSAHHTNTRWRVTLAHNEMAKSETMPLT